MKRKAKDPADAAELRRRAEALARERPAPLSLEGARQTLHELQVHQIELEMQNDELRRARDELDAARARYADLYDGAPVGYCTLSEAGLILQSNLAAAKLFGVARHALVEQPFTRFIRREDQDIFYLCRKRLVDAGAPQSCELGLARDGGAPFWAQLEMTGAPVTRVVLTDVTERRRLEEERERLRVQLAQAHKMEAIGTLAGGIAHDFNNILAGILGGLACLELDLGEASVHREEIEDMVALGKRGAALTKQLLGFGRGGKYDARPLDLARVVEKTSGLFGLARKDITIQLDFPPGLPAVLMDHAQLEQVLLNLLVNAGHAMPEGGRILLSARRAEPGREEPGSKEAAPGHFVKLVVADTGTGMDAPTQARIFEPFFTTKGPGGGTGLGLASVFGILENHGGSIDVRSEPGRGAAFELTLPATDRPFAADVAPVALVQRGTGTILIVDDDAQVSKACARVVGRLGYDVLTAAGGKQALELVRRHGEKISLVLLDMIMPEMSGGQTYDAIRVIAPNAKVLLCSGYSLDGAAQAILDRGCTGFLQKPFDVATLSAKLREML